MAKKKRTTRRDFLKEVGIAATGVAASAAIVGCDDKGSNNNDLGNVAPYPTTNGECLCPVCPSCGEEIEEQKIGQRNTFFCNQCQR